MRLIILAVLPLILLSAKGPRAESGYGSETHPQPLDDSIVVSANRTPTPIREIASSVSVITSEQIRQRRVTLVSELLREVPGIDVVSSGGQGQQTSVFMRGGNSNHTLVIIDGVEMNDPSSPNGAFNFASLSTENIERIEILRGPQSVLYGSDAIGGVIQIITRQGFAPLSLRVASQAGSFDSYRQELELTGAATRVSYGLGLLRDDTRGISAVGEPDGGTERDGYGNTGLTGRLSVSPLKPLQVTFSGRYKDAATDVDQTYGVLDDPNYMVATEELSLSATGQYTATNGKWEQKLGGYLRDVKREGRDDFDLDHPDNSVDNHYKGKRYKADWQFTANFDPAIKVTGGAEVERETFSQELASTSEYGPFESSFPEVETTTRSLFGLAQLNVGNHLFSTLGVRHDSHQQFGEATTYRATLAFLPGDLGTKFKATYGTGFNAPSLYELFDQSYGNLDLQPEESYGWELGVEQELKNNEAKFGLTYFWNRITDLITSDPNTFRPINLDVAESRGVELFINVDAGPVQLSGDYTHSASRQRVGSEKVELIRRPDDKFSARAEVNPFSGTQLALGGKLVGERQDTDFSVFPYKQVTLSSYVVVDLFGSTQLSKAFKLFWRVENLFDEDYVEVLTFGTRPRSAYAGVEFTLGTL